jgi:hypothetical protein
MPMEVPHKPYGRVRQQGVVLDDAVAVMMGVSRIGKIGAPKTVSVDVGAR